MQVQDIVITPVITEFQLHRLNCGGVVPTCGEIPTDVVGETRPVLFTLLVLLTSWIRTSQRNAALFSIDVCEVSSSVGPVSQFKAGGATALCGDREELEMALPD